MRGGARAGEELLGGEAEVLAGGGLDLGDRARARPPAGGLRVEAVEHLVGELGGERPAGERAEGDDADQGALERAHVALDALGDHLERALVGELDVVVLGALAQDRQARGEVGRLDVGDEAGLRSARAGGPRAPAGRAAGGRR